MNETNALHAFFAVIAQVAIALATGNWWIGAAFAVGFYLGWEVDQRRQNLVRDRGLRSLHDLKPWEGFDFYRWSKDALGDLLLPCLTLVNAAVAELL